MKRMQIILATILVAIFTSCENMNVTTVNDESEIFIEARYADAETETKTAISEMVGSKVKFTWLAGDAINVFFGASESSIFVTNTTDRVAQFKGTIGAVTGGGDDLNDETSLWGVYPYNKSTVCDGSSVKISLPHVQEAKADNLADDLYPSVARSSNFTMAFYPICGSFRFKVSNPDIVKVTLSGNDNEYLAGRATVSMSLGGTPEVTDITDGQKELVMTAPDGGYFETDKYYYFVLYPSDLSKGYTITYYKEDTKDSFIKQEAYPIGRNKFGGKTEGDKELAFDKSNTVYAEYVDEFGVNHGKGVEVGGIIWAPVNCGYHETDYPYGKLYQWGRKYGQGYSGPLLDINANDLGVVSDASIPMIKEGMISVIGGNLKKNQHVHFLDRKGDWAYPSNDQVWNAGTEESPIKTVYDPCPDGWRVPTYDELQTLSSNHSSWITSGSQSGMFFSGSNNYQENVPQVFFPAAGFRNEQGSAINRGRRGAYWCSHTRGDSRPCDLYFGSSLYMSFDETRIYGCSVRCVHDIKAYDVEGKNPEEVIDFAVSTLAFASSSMRIFEGDAINMEEALLPIDAKDYDITWGSNTPSIVTVDNDGLVSGIKAGEAIITATVGGVSATCSVIVSKPLKYIDEYALDHGVGTAVGNTIWAPVNCGYHESDYPYGKLYQWGRKYGQGYSDEYDKAPVIIMGPVSLDEGQNPDNADSFYFVSGDQLYWTTTPKIDLWNSGTSEDPKKSSYDPCPDGWRIPTYEELKSLVINRSQWTTHENQSGRWFSGPYNYQENVPQAFFPAAGSRHSEGTSRGYIGTYWYSDYIGYMDFHSNYYYPTFSVGTSTWLLAHSVRCVQE